MHLCQDSVTTVARLRVVARVSLSKQRTLSCLSPVEHPFSHQVAPAPSALSAWGRDPMRMLTLSLYPPRLTVSHPRLTQTLGRSAMRPGDFSGQGYLRAGILSGACLLRWCAGWALRPLGTAPSCCPCQAPPGQPFHPRG